MAAAEDGLQRPMLEVEGGELGGVEGGAVVEADRERLPIGALVGRPFDRSEGRRHQGVAPDRPQSAQGQIWRR
jgi:hypothetical protein